jgi:hypothetical protein
MGPTPITVVYARNEICTTPGNILETCIVTTQMRDNAMGVRAGHLFTKDDLGYIKTLDDR